MRRHLLTIIGINLSISVTQMVWLLKCPNTIYFNIYHYYIKILI